MVATPPCSWNCSAIAGPLIKALLELLLRDQPGQHIDDNLYRTLLAQALIIPQPEPHLSRRHRVHSLALRTGQRLELRQPVIEILAQAALVARIILFQDFIAPPLGPGRLNNISLLFVAISMTLNGVQNPLLQRTVAVSANEQGFSAFPALIDRSTTPPTRVFESGAILFYLAEKFEAFLPTAPTERAECMSWLFWQMSSTAFLGGGFGHFYAYAPEKLEYPINRYAMEVKRQLDVLDQNLASRQYLCGDDYNIADIANHAWYGNLVSGNLYEAQEFLDVSSYSNVIRWAAQIQERPAVKRGLRVNRAWGPEEKQLLERHDASDFD